MSFWVRFDWMSINPEECYLFNIMEHALDSNLTLGNTRSGCRLFGHCGGRTMDEPKVKVISRLLVINMSRQIQVARSRTGNRATQIVEKHQSVQYWTTRIFGHFALDYRRKVFEQCKKSNSRGVIISWKSNDSPSKARDNKPTKFVVPWFRSK